MKDNNSNEHLVFRPQSLGSKNFRAVPEPVQAKIDSLEQDDFVIACVRKIPASDILANKYKHISISLEEGAPIFPESQIPNPLIGRYCRFNAAGVELILKDSPMITKTYSIESPNFGDWSKGTHMVEWDRDVYPREFFPPKQLELSIELLGEEVKDEKLFVFKFGVVEVLNRKKLPSRKSRFLKSDLFFGLNLIRECVGRADVFASNATRDDYLKSLYVDWEILPPGEREGTIDRILSGIKAPTPELRKQIAQRYDLLMTLKPEAFITGSSGLRRYFGAKFSDDLVVFENLEYGNAIYAMFGDWESLSKLTRPQLLKGDRKGFERIIHTGGWERKLKDLVSQTQPRLSA